MAMKSAWITLIGRPSVGKSTLVNCLCGRKISIVAPSPQTTRSTVRGILTEERGQLVFADTPGYHISDKKLNRYLKTATEAALEECELVLYIIDATRSAGQEEREIAGLLAPLAEKLVVAINKTIFRKPLSQPPKRQPPRPFPVGRFSPYPPKQAREPKRF